MCTSHKLMIKLPPSLGELYSFDKYISPSFGQDHNQNIGLQRSLGEGFHIA